ncbi:hypothetical protein BU26DRAFT_64927 [Trematosphaeria pertusa]|uniref:Uncharacterized protein n=1 Tax=Trematosphaeria pertusa TaxID=390896 RepID=A0A6A6I9P4_9PLEO|nr:uncharacterized protein BU26DRAFT_64927 [Trematosphaeria pertusa]KAF2246240.1 hypothetical protein BU26DRAFT_64927 [Trematosphaeria pertusa]
MRGRRAVSDANQGSGAPLPNEGRHACTHGRQCWPAGMRKRCCSCRTGRTGREVSKSYTCIGEGTPGQVEEVKAWSREGAASMTWCSCRLTRAYPIRSRPFLHLQIFVTQAPQDTAHGRSALPFHLASITSHLESRPIARAAAFTSPPQLTRSLLSQPAKLLGGSIHLPLTSSLLPPPPSPPSCIAPPSSTLAASHR